MEIVKNFGLDPILLGAQIINFLVIFYVLKRFAYKPVLDILKKREDSIKQGLKEAEEGRRALEEALEKEKKILRNAQKIAEKIIADAKNQSIEISKKMGENTKKQMENMMTEAREQIMQETKIQEKEIASKVSELAATFLQKLMHDVFGERKQQELVKTVLSKMKKAN